MLKKIGEVIVKILLGIILFIKHVVIGNFRGFLAMVGVALMLIGVLGMVFSFSNVYIWGAGALLVFIAWITGLIKITFTARKK